MPIPLTVLEVLKNFKKSRILSDVLVIHIDQLVFAVLVFLEFCSDVASSYFLEILVPPRETNGGRRSRLLLLLSRRRVRHGEG